MCGIAGILETNGSKRVAPEALVSMGNSMAHRGPDGEGTWISPDGNIGLAHRRLAIVDLSDKAAQPMSDGHDKAWITFNGEIYNHALLRIELEKAGRQFRTDHSDTEVLVHGYLEWGIEGLLQRLEGMYGFAIWDVEKRKLTLARDRIGIKPLYFTKSGGRFHFASEIKAILTDPSIERDIDPQALNHFLSFMVAPAPLTMFKGIFKLPAAHLMEVSAEGTMSFRRYWDPAPGQDIDPAETNRLSSSELESFYTRGIRTRLEQAIDKRMMSDVPFGVFLSGGIDSSANVALMSQMMDRPVDTFTVGFKDHKHLNELEYANRIAKDFKTNHHEVLIDESDMIGYLDDLVHHQDEPIADWVCIPLYFVSKLAKDSGVTVVQVGEGSDEQFCGYDSYMTYLNLHRKFWDGYMKSPSPLRKMVGGSAEVLSSLSPRFDKFTEVLSRAGKDQELFWSGANAFWNVHKQRVLHGNSTTTDLAELEEAGLDITGINASDSAAITSSYLDPFDKAHPEQDQLTRMAYSEFRLRLPELLLMRVDKIGMSTSIEARVPFLDHKLVEFTMDIPMDWKIKGGETKYLLKKALEDLLPDKILYREKMGFAAPMAEWLRGEFGRRAEAAVLNSPLMERGFLNRDHIATKFRHHIEGRRDNALHLWTLFNLTSWYDHWIVGE
ncbi:MAG: asparagine synthase (glutamine-hydrolyzing) [Rhodospirillales bacterium]|nr:asparagine synthase (glutamine-hydrolyzing) [Rhodospirillales bacterium]